MSLLCLENIQNAFRGQLLLRVDYVSVVFFRRNLCEPHTARESRCEFLRRTLSDNGAIFQISVAIILRARTMAVPTIRVHVSGCRVVTWYLP